MENMDATVWAGTDKKQLGIRVGVANRTRYFSRAWSHVLVDLDGQIRRFELTPGFWNDCPEFRDGVDEYIKAWLRKHGLLDWPKGRPPRVFLESLGGNRFRLFVR
jgi:hypothetical protein